MTEGTTAALIEKRAPVQGYSAGIPWSMHLRAYDAYSKKYSPQPALIEGWCRGGFGTEELDDYIPGWRDELSEIAQLLAKIEALQAENERLRVCLSSAAPVAWCHMPAGKELARDWEKGSSIVLKDTP